MNIFEHINKRLRRRKEREAVRRADYIFQVQEHDGELWLTFNGCMVCPERMLSMDIVEAVAVLRRMYVNRNG